MSNHLEDDLMKYKRINDLRSLEYKYKQAEKTKSNKEAYSEILFHFLKIS